VGKTKKRKKFACETQGLLFAFSPFSLFHFPPFSVLSYRFARSFPTDFGSGTNLSPTCPQFRQKLEANPLFIDF
jgi:hypothetical protein